MDQPKHPSKLLLVLGARQYAPVFADAFDDVAAYRIVGFVENLDRAHCAATILNRPVYWIEEVARMRSDHEVICCLATPKRSSFVEQVAALGFRFATLTHPSSVVSSRTSLAEGVSIDAGVVVAGFSSIGSHVRVGRGATIGHHTQVGSYCTLHPASNIAGNCVLEPGVTLGIGSTVIDGCRIGTGSFVAAGAAVTTDVPPGVLVGGVPAKVLRRDFIAP